MGTESMDKVARDFFKHRPDTRMKYYVRHVGNQETVRLSMDCARNYGVNFSDNDVLDNSIEERSMRLENVRALVYFLIFS